MSEESIFNSDQSGEQVVGNPAPVADALPPEVAEFVGEGKKYKTLQDALKSIPHAQTHIQRLEEELVNAKNEVAKAKAVDELLEEMRKQGISQTPQQTPASSAPSTTPVDINSAVEAALARKEVERVAADNASTVIQSFTAKYGDQGEAQFIKLAQESGMSVQSLNALAKTSPNAVLKLAGITKSVAPNVPHASSSVNTSANFNSNNQELSAKVPLVGASTKDVLNAWKNAGLKVRQQNS